MVVVVGCWLLLLLLVVVVMLLLFVVFVKCFVFESLTKTGTFKGSQQQNSS